MQEHVERRRRDAELGRDLFARALVEHAQAYRPRIARIDEAEGGLDLRARRLTVALIADLLLDGRRGLRGVDLAREVVLLEEDEALLRAQLIERDAKGHGAQPGIEPDVLPGELRDVRDHL